MKLVNIPAPDFDLEKTLDSGQVFHWQKHREGYAGMIGACAVYVEQAGARLRFSGGDTQLVRNYFSLDHPLAQICRSFPDDSVMRAARGFCSGLRIIRQPKWECLATFITSSMKQVAHIRQISQALRRRYGEAREIKLQRFVQNADGGSATPRAMPIYSASPTLVNIEQGTARSTDNYTGYTFPSARRLAECSEKELRKCALGYRAKNLLATAQLAAGGEVNLDQWRALSDVDLREKLCALPGVGAKVANCVMLFAYERLRAFPIDVWIARTLQEKYFTRKRKPTEATLRAFAESYFGEHGGYAQQYLFHHARKTSPRGRTPQARKLSAPRT